MCLLACRSSACIMQAEDEIMQEGAANWSNDAALAVR